MTISLLWLRYSLYASLDIIVCHPPQVANGIILSGVGPIYNYEDSVLFSCEKGYILNGSNLIHCGADDEWHPSPPTCELSEYAPKGFS